MVIRHCYANINRVKNLKIKHTLFSKESNFLVQVDTFFSGHIYEIENTVTKYSIIFCLHAITSIKKLEVSLGQQRRENSLTIKNNEGFCYKNFNNVTHYILSSLADFNNNFSYQTQGSRNNTVCMRIKTRLRIKKRKQ